MQAELIFTFLAIGGAIIAAWLLGWHYGARSFRDRNRRFLDIMKKHNADRNPKSQWYQGYTEGIASTLEALERFLGQFKADDDGTT